MSDSSGMGVSMRVAKSSPASGVYVTVGFSEYASAVPTVPVSLPPPKVPPAFSEAS